PPQVLATVESAARICMRLVASATTAIASAPPARSSAATASSFEWVRPTNATLAPAAPSASAMPRPTPWPAPVTRATRLRKFTTDRAAPHGYAVPRAAPYVYLVGQCHG